MHDFSFSNIFKVAFNTFIKNFTDIFVLSVLSVSAVLVLSLFLNSVFLGSVNFMMDGALSADAAGNAGGANPFILFSVYICLVLVFVFLLVFCLFSVFLPLCKGAGMKLKNYFPSLTALLKFLAVAAAAVLFFEIVITVFPAAAKAVSGGDGYSVGVLAISVVSFALIAGFVVFALKYGLFFLPLLEKAGLKEAFKKSGTLTYNCRMKIFVLAGILFLINFFAKYLIFLLLVTVPFSVLVIIYAYLELSGAEFAGNK
ncbi:MAG: hypothetical protein LBL00_04760 [Endomicrobium sp.]|jgi:hypothetical protein|nr:hypothetical protein [Endomicrobium sp.]